MNRSPFQNGVLLFFTRFLRVKFFHIFFGILTTQREILHKFFDDLFYWDVKIHACFDCSETMDFLLFDFKFFSNVNWFRNGRFYIEILIRNYNINRSIWRRERERLFKKYKNIENVS